MPDRSHTTDVLIIGGGIIGLSCAWHLAREGLRVTVVERHRCGREASWAGAGMLDCPSWHRRDTFLELVRQSLRMYPAFVDELRERSRINPEYVRCGSLSPLLTDQQLQMARRRVEETERHCGREAVQLLRLLTPEQAREREPALNLTPEVRAVLHAPASAQVRNPRLLEALLTACTQLGVTLLEEHEVHALLRDGERVTGVRCGQSTLHGGHVLLAAGAWSSLIEHAPGTRLPVYPVRGQMILMHMHPRPFTHLITRGRCYLVPRLDGQILLGATEEHESGYEKRNTLAGLEALMSRATQLVPAIAQATVLGSWSGLRPGTPDRRPFIGAVPGAPGLWAATGHYRSGLILAPVTGAIMTDLIVRGRTPHDLDGLTPGREIPEGKPPRSFPS